MNSEFNTFTILKIEKYKATQPENIRRGLCQKDFRPCEIFMTLIGLRIK